MQFYKYSNIIATKDQNKFIINALSNIKESYPHIKEWFFNKVIKEIGQNREIFLLEFKKEIVALLILKYNEKKISTIYVHPDYRHKGFGRLLIKIAKRELKTFKPKIIISEKYIGIFENLLRKQQFKETGIVMNRYKEGLGEYYFNYKEEELNGFEP